jgi:hypothetical protein
VQTISAVAVVLDCEMVDAAPDVGGVCVGVTEGAEVTLGDLEGADVGVTEGAEVTLGDLEGADVELVGAEVPADTVKVKISPCSQCTDTSHANTSSPTSAPVKV